MILTTIGFSLNTSFSLFISLLPLLISHSYPSPSLHVDHLHFGFFLPSTYLPLSVFLLSFLFSYLSSYSLFSYFVFSTSSPTHFIYLSPSLLPIPIYFFLLLLPCPLRYLWLFSLSLHFFTQVLYSRLLSLQVSPSITLYNIKNQAPMTKKYIWEVTLGKHGSSVPKNVAAIKSFGGVKTIIWKRRRVKQCSAKEGEKTWPTLCNTASDFTPS